MSGVKKKLAMDVGDRVVTNTKATHSIDGVGSLQGDSAVGLAGTIISTRNDPGESHAGVGVAVAYDYLVQFDRRIGGHSGMWTAVRGRPGHCWWVSETILDPTGKLEDQPLF